jgi:molecular chaperone GrpE
MSDDLYRQSQPDRPIDGRPDHVQDGTEPGETAGGEASVTLSYAQYEELKALARERDEYLRRLQRAVADYQNLQKRTERFQEAAREAALRSLADDFLPVADGLARALEAAAQTDGAEGIVEGLQLVEKEFYDALAGVGIRPVDALGQKFDPHYHEAAMQLPVAGVPPNTVVQELKKGFLLGETVVRPTQVVVSSSPGPSGGADAVDSQGRDA